MKATIKPLQDNPNAAWTPKVSERLQEQVDALRADNAALQNNVVGPLRERIKWLESFRSEPDCRTCKDFTGTHSHGQCWAANICRDGDMHTPMPPVRLWRTT